MPPSAESGRAARPLGALGVGSLLLLLLAGPVRLVAQEGATGDPAAGLARALAAAEAALEVDEPEIAESHYRDALREGWLVLGALAAEGGDVAGAVDAFDRAAGSTTDDRRAVLARALVEVEAGQAEQAALALRRLAARDPADVEVRQTLARALAASGGLAEAIQELEEVRALAPERLETLYTLATAYLRQGRVEQAAALLEQLAAERPGPETWVLIGRTWRDHADYNRAREALEKALELNPRQRRANQYLGSVALLAEGRGAIDEAIDRFHAELELAPDDPITNLFLGIALVETRRYQEAVEPLRLAGRLPQAERDAAHFLGRAFLGLDRPEEAVPALRRALALTEERGEQNAADESEENRRASIHYQLALALRRTGAEDEAAIHFERAKDSTARLAETSRDFLRAYLGDDAGGPATFGPPLDLGLPARLDATQREQLARRVGRSLARTYLNLGVFKTRQRRFDGAALLLATAARLDPALPRVHYSLGVALFNAARFGEAAVPLARALEESPDDDALRRMLALSHLNGDAPERALELLRDDPQRSAQPALQYAYGVALVRSERAAEAEAVFAELLRTNADWPELRVILGQAYAQQGDYDAAVASLRRALELDPGVAEAHSTLGDVFLRQGKLTEAEQELEAELATHPTDERARYTLALVMDLNRKPAAAIEVLREHLVARPRSADGRYLLGKILLAEGAAEEALEQLSVAAELAPDDPNVRYQRGQALQKLGRRDEASREFEAFRELKAAQREREGP